VFFATLINNKPLVLAVVVGLIAAKWLAAEVAGRMWRLGTIDSGLMGSLTIPQVAAALATALVGYQAVNVAGERLLDEAMLNTVLVLVVVTSLTGPLLTEHFLRRLRNPKDDPNSGSPLGSEMPALDHTMPVKPSPRPEAIS
jgi:Kef-type K+ transport system membrane component KefB